METRCRLSSTRSWHQKPTCVLGLIRFVSAWEDVTMSTSAAEMEFSGTEGQIEQWKEEIETETEKAETAQKRDKNKSRCTSIRNIHHRITTANA